MLPTLAIVGRTNVGKSTLFNRLAGKRRALTHDLPGVTRDRLAGEARRPSGGLVVLVDTGGFEAETGELIPHLVREQAALAVRSADAVLLVVDGAQGLTPADEELAAVLHRSGRPVVVAVNKVDRGGVELGAGEFAALGFPLVAVSAEHGRGIRELWDLLEPLLPPSEEEPAPPPELAIAIVGRPNVGKSSILNRILGEERVLVSEVPGTTRDAIDTVIEHQGGAIRLIDTAGIRRRGRTDRGPEVLSVVMARKAIERADVCVLVLDGSAGVTAQDTHVAGEILEAGRGTVIAMNKIDLLAGAAGRTREELSEQVLDKLKFLKGTPVVFTSATTGAGLDDVLPRALEVGQAFRLRIGTGELNRVLHAAWERHPPPGGKRPTRLYYATQVGSRPPRFALFVNTRGPLHFSYLRFLENSLRDAFPLAGVPVRFIMRGKQERSG